MGIYLKSIGIGVVAAYTILAQAHISASRIRAHARFLSSDLLEGRGVGTRGGQLAEEYLATAMAGFGVQPAGENGTWFETVPMVGVTTQPDSRVSVVQGGKKIDLRWQQDFVATSHRQNPTESFDAEAVFVGHGIVSKTENWDDYKATDVRGKVVLVFTNEPQPNNPEVFKGRTLTYAGRWTYKFEEAARQGALACLIIHTTDTAGYGWDVVRNSWSKEDPQMALEAGRPALQFAGWVTKDAGEQMLSLSGHSVEELMKAADSRDFRPVPLRIRIAGQLNTKVRNIRSRNVLGRVEGSDPRLKNEIVLFSAHWDHLGIGIPVNGDAVYNGAIDNATGCAIVLEEARVFAQLNVKPKRSVVFAFWTAEESGLRGAEYYAAHPLFPPEKTAVNLNFDAIRPSARARDMVLTGAERSTLWPMAQEAARRYDLEITPEDRPEQGFFYRSDHFMLARIGIPAFEVAVGNKITGKPDNFGAQAFEEYNAKHYHQPSDEYDDNWDFTSLQEAARFGFLLGMNIANSEKLPRWNPGDEFAVPGR